LKVLELKRVSIGSFGLDIESGKWRYLLEEEENLLIGKYNLKV
jgi:23S rRNA pseudouridine2605 synthase